MVRDLAGGQESKYTRCEGTWGQSGELLERLQATWEKPRLLLSFAAVAGLVVSGLEPDLDGSLLESGCAPKSRLRTID